MSGLMDGDVDSSVDSGCVWNVCRVTVRVTIIESIDVDGDVCVYGNRVEQ